MNKENVAYERNVSVSAPAMGKVIVHVSCV